MYDIVGINGNAYSIMGYVSSAMKREGKSQEEIDVYYKDATSSDYTHLICVSMEIIDKLNERYEYEDEEY